MLVTKNVPVERIREVLEAGPRDFGENRVQELLQKKPQLPGDLRWHFVGHLQTNKVKSLLGEIVLLHSLDRIALAEEIEKQAERRDREVAVLIQVNTSGEITKSGFAPEQAEGAVEAISRLKRIRICGLMTIGPFTEDEQVIRRSFERLRNLRDALKKQFPALIAGTGGEPFHLSMGMSSDFEIAIEEGATIVRIGTAVFGERAHA